MLEFLKKLFDTDFMPQGQCFFWKPEVLWLHAVSDGLIALAYYAIPVALVHLVRKRRDLAFNWMFLLFGAFIFACGTTHLLGVWTLWVPAYRIDGVVKLGTALLSLGTAALLWPLVPRILDLPSPARMEAANRELQGQIAERRRAEEEVRRLNADLERRVEERTCQLKRSNDDLQRFAYIASHDLKEPLRMVSQYTQLLATRYKGRLDADADEFIAFAVGGATRMHALIESLLTYARLDTRAGEPAPVDCGALCDQAIANLAVAIREHGARVTRDPLPRVIADAPQIVQLFQNLIGNGIKFSHGGRPEVHVGAERRDGAWLFSVRDDGIGIDPGQADRIFEVFLRLHHREEYPGTGIGLAVCKKIVERHGGRIWVEPAPGRGSIFRFTLPE